MGAYRSFVATLPSLALVLQAPLSAEKGADWHAMKSKGTR
jgi:hypothetical protein